MVAGRPRSYDQRITITTNTEADLYYFGKDELGITAREAITLGYIGRIDSEIIVRKDISKEDLDRYFEIRNRVYKTQVLERERDEDVAQRVSNIAGEIRNDVSNKKLETSNEPENINWNKIPADQKVRVYTQQIFTRDERVQWISRYVSSDEEFRNSVLKLFCEEFIVRFKADTDRPFSKVDAGEIKNVLVSWAEAEEGV
jgi:hypothetical protein